MYPIIQTYTEIELKFSRNRTRRVKTMKVLQSYTSIQSPETKSLDAYGQSIWRL